MKTIQFRLGNYKIVICRTKWHTKEYMQEWFADRKKKGLCLRCGELVTHYNPYTGIKYRKCEKHRKEENHQSFKRRSE